MSSSWLCVMIVMTNAREQKKLQIQQHAKRDTTTTMIWDMGIARFRIGSLPERVQQGM